MSVDYTAADFSQPRSKSLTGYPTIAISHDPQQQLLEWLPIEIGERRQLAGYFDDLAGRVVLIEIEIIDPQAEQLANIGQFRIILARELHASDRVRLAEPDERAADHG